MPFPTRQQIMTLAKYGVIPGTTSLVCRRMLQYIEAFPQEHRAGRAKDMCARQRDYLCKSVVFEGLPGTGIVRAVYAKKVRLGTWEFVADVMWHDTLRDSTVELKHLVVLQNN